MSNSKFVPLKIEDNDSTYRNIWNPLRYMTEEMVAMMIDSARSGRISQIQIVYSLVESSDLTLSMCMDRRESALPDWTIKRRDTRRYRSYDEKLAQEQEHFLYDQFVQCEDSGTLLRGIDTLHKAVFRGLGVIEPIYDDFGLREVISLDPWNFAIDFSRHDKYGQYPLYWNPTGADIIDFKGSLERIPSEQIVANFSPHPIDNFALHIFLAENMGFESYCKLVSRKGVPATYIIAPEDLPSENLQTWAQKAVDCAKGGSGAFPYGSNIITEKIDPNNGQSIQDFLEYMAKQIVLASTGGTLTSLAQATGLGSNIADVQNDVFKTIVRHDASKIGDLINRGIAKKLLDWKFPGKPHLVYFDLSNEDKQNPEKYLDDAVRAKNAGLEIDLSQLQDLTCYKLTKSEEKPSNEWNVPRIQNEDKNEVEEWKKEEQPIVENTETVQEAVEEKVNEPTKEDVKHGVSILQAFDKVLTPIKELFKKLFTAKTKEESDQIIEELNTEINRIEESEDTELVQAVQDLLKEEFERKE